MFIDFPLDRETDFVIGMLKGRPTFSFRQGNKKMCHARDHVRIVSLFETLNSFCLIDFCGVRQVKGSYLSICCNFGKDSQTNWRTVIFSSHLSVSNSAAISDWGLFCVAAIFSMKITACLQWEYCSSSKFLGRFLICERPSWGCVLKLTELCWISVWMPSSQTFHISDTVLTVLQMGIFACSLDFTLCFSDCNLTRFALQVCSDWLSEVEAAVLLERTTAVGSRSECLARPARQVLELGLECWLNIRMLQDICLNSRRTSIRNKIWWPAYVFVLLARKSMCSSSGTTTRYLSPPKMTVYFVVRHIVGLQFEQR